VYTDGDWVSGRLVPPGMMLQARGWAGNEDEANFTQVRPLQEWSPFWFIALWGSKA
jgi:hypothetical protein